MLAVCSPKMFNFEHPAQSGNGRGLSGSRIVPSRPRYTPSERHQRPPTVAAWADRVVKFTSEQTGQSFWRKSRSADRAENVMQYLGVEYFVVQLTDGSGWRWQVRFADGRNKSGVTAVSRTVAIKQAKYEIDRMLKGRK